MSGLSMSIGAEKMRQLARGLKSAGERMRSIARFPETPAAFLRQKVQLLKEQARQLRARSSELADPDSADAAPPGRDRPQPPGPAAWDVVPARAAAEPLSLPEESPRGGPFSSAGRILRWAFIALLIVLALPYGLILVYRVIDPPFSALMARQWLSGVSVRHQWVDFQNISPALPLAVVISEDAAFCRHAGVDWRAVSEAIGDAEDGEPVRGASTIPMQTAKNLFLWNGQSYLRKGLEVPLAYALSAIWPKRRVLEIYLNIAEWGPGIFGAEAAARYHFGKSAAQLGPREAALLAAALPSPKTRNAGRPKGLTARIAARIGARVGREAPEASCVFARGG
jgi:monofunctional glycosyltransferase